MRQQVNVDRVWGDSRDVKRRSVDVGEWRGTTRDLSATGVYFETGRKHREGSMIRFTIDFDNPIGGGKSQLECRRFVVPARDACRVLTSRRRQAILSSGANGTFVDWAL